MRSQPYNFTVARVLGRLPAMGSIVLLLVALVGCARPTVGKNSPRNIQGSSALLASVDTTVWNCPSGNNVTNHNGDGSLNFTVCSSKQTNNLFLILNDSATSGQSSFSVIPASATSGSSSSSLSGYALSFVLNNGSGQIQLNPLANINYMYITKSDGGSTSAMTACLLSSQASCPSFAEGFVQ